MPVGSCAVPGSWPLGPPLILIESANLKIDPPGLINHLILYSILIFINKAFSPPTKITYMCNEKAPRNDKLATLETLVLVL
jgi:hypothetical protein